MQNMVIQSQVDVGDGPVPFLNVVAPEGQAMNRGYAHRPDDIRAYVQREYNDMRDIAATLLAQGKLHKGDPIVYPANGGAVAARAIADVTGGRIFPLQRNDEDRSRIIPPELRDVLASAPRVVMADDVIHTGSALRRTVNSLKDVFHGELTVMANRILNKSLTMTVTGPNGSPGGLIAYFLPEKAQVYAGDLYNGRDNIKISGFVHALGQQGFTLDDLARGYEQRGEGTGTAGGAPGAREGGFIEFVRRAGPGAPHGGAGPSGGR